MGSFHEHLKNVANGKEPSPSNGMNLEFLRQASFKEWFQDAESGPLQLAHSGLYKANDVAGCDEVICYSCKKSFGTKDDPIEKHVKVSPDCSFLDKSKTNISDPNANVPIKRPEQDISLEEVYEDITGPHGKRKISTLSEETTKTEGFSLAGHAKRRLKYPTTSSQRKGPNHSLAFMDHMRSEQERRSTFYDWPKGAWQHPTALAAAGFFYTGSADRVQCAFCRGELLEWEPHDGPMEEHQSHFPDCPFAKGKCMGNIPILTEPDREGPDFYKPQDQELHRRSKAQEPTAVHPKYASEAVRSSTYVNWPANMQQTPESLAKAGFFYTGTKDCVKCFFCDGGLRNWNPEEKPSLEHRKWFPHCTFAQEIHVAAQLNNQVLEPPRFYNPRGNTQMGEKELPFFFESPNVQTVIRMKLFPVHHISKLMKERLNKTGKGFPSARDLLDAMYKSQDRKTKRGDTEGEGGKRRTEGVEGGKINTQCEEDQSNCIICVSSPVRELFLPCAHFVCCTICALKVKDCPMCRHTIKGTMGVELMPEN